MRRLVYLLTALTAFAVAGCSQPNSDQTAKKAPASGPVTKVTGTVSLVKPIPLSGQAELVITLVDATTQSTTPLATKTIAPVKKLPLQFSLDFAPEDINRNDIYVVHARMTDGDRHFTMSLQAPVLTKGAKNKVNIRLIAQATPTEKVVAAFDKVKAHIGGMNESHGTSLDKDVSRAWQAFRDKVSDEVMFVRELSDYGDKGFTSTDYAYKHGQPWVVEQQKKASQQAAPSEVNRAGWNDDGELVLAQHIVGGTTSTLSDADAAALKTQASAIYAQVNKGHKPSVRKGKM